MSNIELKFTEWSSVGIFDFLFSFMKWNCVEMLNIFTYFLSKFIWTSSFSMAVFVFYFPSLVRAVVKYFIF